MGRKYLLVMLVFSTLFFSSLRAQKQIWEIYTNDDQPYVGVVLDSFSNDTLYVKIAGYKRAIALEAIKILKRKRPSKGGIGALSGMAIGGLAMNLYGRAQAQHQNTFPIDFKDLGIALTTGIGVFTGGLIGYFVGVALGTDEYYNFSKLTLEKKRNIIAHLVARN